MATDARSPRRFAFPDGITIYITPFKPEADTNRELLKAGIELTPEQKTQLRQAFSEAIANTLTPEQYQQWEQYVSDHYTQQIEQARRGEFPIERDPVREARDWEEAGV